MKTIKNKFFAILAVVLLSTVATFADTKQQLTPLENKIRKELVTLPWVGVFDNLAFEVNGDTVTLYGQVVRPTSRSSAEKRVAKLDGVKHVINKIEVLPLSGFDDRIRQQAYYSIYNQAGLYRYLLGANPSIRIIVNRGHVTLEGIVSNKTDARLAYFAVNGIPGVFSVTNNLQTEKASKM